VKKSKILSEFQISRRTVMAGATLVPLAALMPAPPAEAQSPATASTTVFNRDQRQILEAFIDRLIPADEIGPGAVECGVADYIDRCLAGFNAAEKPQFLEGLAALDLHALRTEHIAFASLPTDRRDAVLTAVDNNQVPGLKDFFNRVRRLTLEGMFSDPVYGGNKNFAGWDLIRYPGAKLAVGPEDQKMTTPPKPYRRELYTTEGPGQSHTGEDHGH
jgi:hypothetical protein